MPAQIEKIGTHDKDGWHWSVLVQGDLIEGEAGSYEQAVADAADAEG